jgi:hypothetical protein
VRISYKKFAVGCVAGGIALWVAVTLAFPRSLDKQYLAPQFTCACGYTMVMEFSGGHVRLYNLGHQLRYEAGTYETNGDKLIWHLPMYRTDFLLVPSHFSLVATDRSTGYHLTFKRRLRPFGIGQAFDTSAFPLSKQPLEKYIKDLRWVVDEKPAPNNALEPTATAPSVSTNK